MTQWPESVLRRPPESYDTVTWQCSETETRSERSGWHWPKNVLGHDRKKLIIIWQWPESVLEDGRKKCMTVVWPENVLRHGRKNCMTVNTWTSFETPPNFCPRTEACRNTETSKSRPSAGKSSLDTVGKKGVEHFTRFGLSLSITAHLFTPFLPHTSSGSWLEQRQQQQQKLWWLVGGWPPKSVTITLLSATASPHQPASVSAAAYSCPRHHPLTSTDVKGRFCLCVYEGLEREREREREREKSWGARTTERELLDLIYRPVNDIM